MHELESASDGFACTGSRSTKRMASLIGPLATELTFATPLEWGGIRVPCAGSGLQPIDQLCRVCRCLASQCTSHDMRWMDSVIFSHDPLSGVYSGMMPWSNNHTTKRAVR